MKKTVLLFVASLLISSLFLLPSVRKITMQLVNGADRELLSTIVVSSRGGASYKVLKVKEKNKLLLELYLVSKSNDAALVDSLTLTDRQDAYLKVGENKYNLFTKDIDNDGDNEILAPTLDKSMKPRLNIFQINFENQKLVKLSTH